MAGMARAIEGIPIVGSTTERDQLFTNPARDQRVQLRDSGAIQRFTTGGWITDFAGVGISVTASPYNADPLGLVDATTAIQAAITACSALGGGLVTAPAGTFTYTTLSIPANVTVQGAGRGVTIFARSGYGSGTGDQPLFGIRLTGNYAGLRDCSVKGLWNPVTPTTQTYDVNIAPYGNSVQHTVVEGVETYNAHLGYLVGGLIGSATASWSAQSHNRAVQSYAHDTYDLGFGLVSKGRTDADTAIGCAIIDCWQSDSYATAGCEVRYQRGAQVVNFNTRNNLNASLGAGVRLEETLGALVVGVQAAACYMPVQIINDTSDSDVIGVVARGSQHCVYLRNTADIRLSDITAISSGRTAILLDYADGRPWLTFNERITIDGFSINGGGSSTSVLTSAGIGVAGVGYTEANVVLNGKDLKILNGTVRRMATKGIWISAGKNWEVANVTLEDNGTGTGIVDGTGLFIANPSPNGVVDTTNPANGWAHDLTFITTGSQPFTINDAAGGAADAKLTRIGDYRSIGGGTALTTNDRTFTQTTLHNAIRARHKWTTSAADGVVLEQATTALDSPRLYFTNSADGTSAVLRASGNGLIISTGGVPGASSGTARVLVQTTALGLQAGVGLYIGAGTVITKHLSATVAWDPASVAAAAQTTTTVTVTGAALGDTVTVGFNKDLQGMQLTGYVSAADTVTVVLRNGTAGALDLASGTLRADVWQH